MAKPVGISLVVCDNVYQEVGGKTALVGLFNRIVARRFPTTHSRLCVYVSVTSVRPGTHFKLVIKHSESDHRVVELQGPPPPNTGVLTVCDLQFVLENVVFPEPGRYFIEFWADDFLVLQRPFEVEPQK